MKKFFLIFCVFTEIINFNKSEDFKFNKINSTHINISIRENINEKYTYKLLIEKDNYKIELNELRKDDSIHFNYPNCFNQIPLSNKIYFYKNNKLIRTLSIPYKKIKAKNYLNQEIEFLDNRIYDLCIVKYGKRYFVTIESEGGCNSCNESISCYTLNGNLAYFWYGNKKHVEKIFHNKKFISYRALENLENLEVKDCALKQ